MYYIGVEGVEVLPETHDYPHPCRRFQCSYHPLKVDEGNRATCSAENERNV